MPLATCCRASTCRRSQELPNGPALPSSRGRIHAARRELSLCPAQLAPAQQSPLAPWPWLWVCLRSHGTTQNRLLLIATRQRARGRGGGRGGVTLGQGGWWGEKLAFNERERTAHGQRSIWLPSYLHACALMQSHWTAILSLTHTHTVDSLSYVNVSTHM